MNVRIDSGCFLSLRIIHFNLVPTNTFSDHRDKAIEKNRTSVISFSLHLVTSAPIASYYSLVLNASSATYCRTGTCSTPSLYYYEAIKINVYTAGNYIITSSSSMDTYGYLYTNTFYATYPSFNLLQFNDDGVLSGGDFSLSSVLQIMTDYILVATTYSSSDVGAFLIIVQGPAVVSFSPGNSTSQC